MASSRQGSLRLFRFAGIDVFLHWSWFLVAAFEISGRSKAYSSITWNILEYVALFAIVLLHEYGHALACRQVGGNANRIMLWPLGGVAFVDPPPRPGATLWSIAAGPLVNVGLIPVFIVLGYANRALGGTHTDLHALLRAVAYINVGLLIFNVMPIYPLDGGQILRSLLWFVIGRARSLMAATVIGFVGVLGMFALAFWARSLWFGILGGFILLNCWTGLKHARALLRLSKLPRREGFACPRCKAAPPIGEMWKCPRCTNAFDTFVSQAACPYCGTQFPVTQCLECGAASPMTAWPASAPVAYEPVTR